MSDEFIIVHEHMPHGHSPDNDLPTYTLQDAQTDTLEDRIAATPSLALPILDAAHIRSPADQSGPPSAAAALLARDLCAAFHAAVRDNQDDVVAQFVARGYVSPDTPDAHGETPLLTAARRGHVGTVRALLALGARVDAYGQSPRVLYESGAGGRATRFQRTPLQCAAEEGHLAVVRVLVEEAGADDGLVAPDGALALRLAAAAGHRDIVAYLPARRGGGWRRWKTSHAKQVRRARRAAHRIGVFLYYALVAPVKLLVWHVPRWAWENRARADWMVRRARAVPAALRRVPGCAWRAAKAVPAGCRAVARATGKLVRGVPKVLLVLLGWMQSGCVRLCGAAAHGAAKVASVAHTALCAAVSLCRRITLGDVWRGVVVAARALLVDVPRAAARWAADAGRVAYESLVILLGTLGKCVYYGVVGLGWVLVYVPKRLWEIAAAMGRSVANTFDEVMVHVNPKRI